MSTAADREKNKWFVLRGFLSQECQLALLKELEDKIKDADGDHNVLTSKKPVRLRMHEQLKPAECSEFLEALAERAFAAGLDGLVLKRPFMTIGWLYGENASMTAHYDAPSFQRAYEWVVSFNVGLTVVFIADDEELMLHSGDVLIMDTLNVKHGVTRVVQNSCPPWCPLKKARLGLLMWESRNPDLVLREQLAMEAGSAVEGVENLFN